MRECPGQLRHSSVAGGLVVSMGPPEFGVHGQHPRWMHGDLCLELVDC